MLEPKKNLAGTRVIRARQVAVRYRCKLWFIIYAIYYRDHLFYFLGGSEATGFALYDEAT